MGVFGDNYGPDEGSQHMVSMRNKKVYHQKRPLIWSSEFSEVVFLYKNGGRGEGGGRGAGNHGGLHIHLKHLKSTASWIHSFSLL